MTGSVACSGPRDPPRLACLRACLCVPHADRSAQAGLMYHVLNRGNGRMRLFPKDADFAAFKDVLAEGLQRYPVDLLTYCLMS